MSSESLKEDGGRCRNARDFAREKLEEADGLVKPRELADQYECTIQHMQETMRQLALQGEAERVGYGRYVAASGEGAEEIDANEEADEEDGEDESTPVEFDECPYETCGFEGDSVAGFRAHANATKEHDWSDIKDEMPGEVESSEVDEENPPMIPGELAVVLVGVVVVLVFASWYLNRSGEQSRPRQPGEREESTGGLLQE